MALTCCVSGCGKSTLLRALAGQLINSPGDYYGDVFANGISTQDLNNWCYLQAFVDQEALYYPHLTVKEYMIYAADISLPTSVSKEDKEMRVTSVISNLGLTLCANNRIGGPMTSYAISGGEKRRLSIAMALIRNTPLVFLDEPTTGLDAFTAQATMQYLRSLCTNAGKTMIMSIHQPRISILELFDRIILMSAGQIVYFGSLRGAMLYFEQFNCPIPPLTNPSDYFMGTVDSIAGVERFWSNSS